MLIATLLFLADPGAVGTTAEAQKICVLAVAVATLLQGLKKFFPQVQGNWALALSTLASLGGAYVAATPGQIMSPDFFVTAIGAALGSNGIHNYLTGGQTAPPQSWTKKQ
jgi:hypothetical protein